MSEINKVAVVGLGYVGLPFALLAARKGLTVIGIDIDKQKIKALNNGTSYIDDVSSNEVATTSAHFSDQVKLVGDAEAIIICVPTPVTEDKQPNLIPIQSAVTSIAPHIQNGALVVIESTVNPGVCDDIVTPILEKITKKKVGKDIFLAHCPERINPGDPTWNVSNINRVVGANTKREVDMAVSLYAQLIDGNIKPMESLKEAEAVKVVENSFRDINIAFVNELAMSFHKLGINVENVIDGAATKPFAFMPHHPGCGVGGHCIPVDPYYLIEYAHDYGFEHTFLMQAREINESMPKFTVSLLIESLAEISMEPDTARVALLGLSYKANVGDDRESPSYEILNLLKELQVDISVYDPYIAKLSTASSLSEALRGVDAVVITTAHKDFLDELTIDNIKASDIKVLIDGRNLLRHLKNDLITAGIKYQGIGL